MTEKETQGSPFWAFDIAKPRGILYEITLLSAIGVFLDGFDISAIGATLPVLKVVSGFSYVNTALGYGLLAASTTIGMLFGAVTIGYVTDLKGRKFMYMWDMAIFAVLTALIAISFNYSSMFVFRLVLGVGIGADYAISTTIISEFSPIKSRGKLLAANASSWWIGAAVAYTLAYFLIPFSSIGWRYLFAVGIIPAVIVLVLRRGVPESARWLANEGQEKKAEDVEKKVTGHMNPIKITRKKTSFTEIFSSKYVRATIFISVFWFSYDVAFYGIGLFNPTILGALGLSKTRALLGSAVFSVMAVVGSVLCIAFIDKIGRKKITLIGFVGMTISLFVLAILALRIPKDAFSMASVSAAIIAMFILFEVTQTMGPGSTDLIYPQELYPTSIRATGQGWGTSFSRVGAILGLTVFPTLMDVFGLGYGLLFFFVFALLGIIVTLLLGVETTGKSLEELTR